MHWVYVVGSYVVPGASSLVPVTAKSPHNVKAGPHPIPSSTHLTSSHQHLPPFTAHEAPGNNTRLGNTLSHSNFHPDNKKRENTTLISALVSELPQPTTFTMSRLTRTMEQVYFLHTNHCRRWCMCLYEYVWGELPAPLPFEIYHGSHHKVWNGWYFPIPAPTTVIFSAFDDVFYIHVLGGKLLLRQNINCITTLLGICSFLSVVYGLLRPEDSVFVDGLYCVSIHFPFYLHSLTSSTYLFPPSFLKFPLFSSIGGIISWPSLLTWHCLA